MRAISLHEPYASLAACGLKTYETRSKRTHYRGPLVLHASKKWGPKIRARCVAMADYFDHPGVPIPDVADSQLAWSAGCYVALVELTAVFRMDAIVPCKDGPGYLVKSDGRFHEKITEDDYVAGDWQPGRWAWVMKNRQLLRGEPLLAKGRQWLWTPTKTETAAIHAAAGEA